MKNTSMNNQKPRRQRALLYVVLAMLLALLAAVPLCIGAGAESDAQYNANAFAKITQPKIKYKVEVTTESKASGWNSASLKLGYRGDGDKTERQNWDIKDDISGGKTITKEFSLPKDDVPSVLRLYLDFGGGFTVRSHSGRIKFYADGAEVMNEAYSARSYPFVSSNETLTFQIDGIHPTIVKSRSGAQEVYTSVNKAWDAAKEMNGATVILWEDSHVKGTLEVKNNVTLDLNGHLFANTEVGSLFKVKKGGTLSIIDSDPNRDTGETFQVTTGMTSETDTENRSFKLKGGGIYHGASEGNGGAINVENGGTLHVTGCTFTDCHSTESYGGAIYCEGNMSLKGTRFIFCTALERYGGAINITGEHDVSLENLTFDRCAARDGGAISFRNDDDDGVLAKFKNCTFNLCHADNCGGALYHGGCTEINASGLTFNKCSAQCGGGVYYATGWSAFDITVSPITITDSKFENCTAETGGAIQYFKAHDMALENVVIKNCEASEDGGAIHIRSRIEHKEDEDFVQYEFRVRNCEISNCAAADEGGAVYTWCDDNDDCSRLLVYNCSIHDNTAKKGGAFYVESPFVYLANSAITKNNATAGDGGGGVYVDSMYDIDVADEIVIRDNTAKGKPNNLCLQNGVFSSAKIYCGGLSDGSYIGVSSTSSGSATVAKNVSQFQMSKFLKADNGDYGFSIKNTKNVETKLYASMLSKNTSVWIIVAGVVVIAGVTGCLYFKKRRKESEQHDATDE